MRVRSRRMPSAAACAALLLAVAAPTLAAPPGRDELRDAARMELARALERAQGGRHLVRLFALRQLRDPDLAPLFATACRSDDWLVQVHGALGLLELGIDPETVRPLAELDPRAQEAVVANAFDRGLMPAASAERWRDDAALAPMVRLLVLAEDHLAGRAPPAAALAPLVDDADDRVAIVAALLLATAGESSAPSTLNARIDQRPAPERESLLAWVFGAVRQYRIRAAADFVRQQLAAGRLAPEVHAEGVRALLAIDPAGSGPAWTALAASSDRPAHRIRCALDLLAAGPDVPPDAWNALPDDEPLVAALRRSAEAMRTGRERGAALAALVATDHEPSARWILSIVDELPAEDAAPPLAALVDRAALDGRGRGQRAALAVEAVAELAPIRPDLVLARLERAEDDGPMQEVLLLGLLEHGDPTIAAAALRLRRIGTGRTDALALLVAAAGVPHVGDDDQRRLGAIARGGMDLSEGLRARAAWLYLRHDGSSASALAAALATVETDRSGDPPS